jgi:hypothetical protein
VTTFALNSKCLRGCICHEDSPPSQRQGRSPRPTPRRWEKMSARQMVCHLADGFRLYMSLKTARPVAVPYPRIFLKWAALWAPIPWPKGYKRTAEPGGPLHAPAPRLPVAASSPFWPDVRRRVDAPGLPSHGSPPAPVRRVRSRSTTHSRMSAPAIRAMAPSKVSTASLLIRVGV